MNTATMTNAQKEFLLLRKEALMSLFVGLYLLLYGSTEVGYWLNLWSGLNWFVLTLGGIRVISGFVVLFYLFSYLKSAPRSLHFRILHRHKDEYVSQVSHKGYVISGYATMLVLTLALILTKYLPDDIEALPIDLLSNGITILLGLMLLCFSITVLLGLRENDE
ncbi:hypothetical protein CS022_16210 [Veronia nyctiphanis]|uniref:Uncharacterized protein n=1 Tax=Veronia nyctiphanis TaxID=1278244 RepID=A0A4Q0YT99_9GAMM|nr:hypothetical protein [Veronia nyctiphanis]RXJ72369.1 hypothetical protein CS022_16210 [Veronia nyctiphanis]